MDVDVKNTAEEEAAKALEAAKKAGEYVRQGKGRFILEVQTNRYRGNSMSAPAKYRSKETLTLWCII